jgi:hypothetical protein
MKHFNILLGFMLFCTALAAQSPIKELPNAYIGNVKIEAPGEEVKKEKTFYLYVLKGYTWKVTADVVVNNPIKPADHIEALVVNPKLTWTIKWKSEGQGERFPEPILLNKTETVTRKNISLIHSSSLDKELDIKKNGAVNQEVIISVSGTIFSLIS